MKNTMRSFVFMMILFLLSACLFTPNNRSVFGKWVVAGDKISLFGYVDSVWVDHSIDDYFTASFYEITDDWIYTYSNDVYDGFYYKDSISLVDISEDSLITNEDELGYMYHFKNKDLVLKIDALWAGTEKTLKKYRGKLPPDNWLGSIQQDVYEPDDEVGTITTISVNEEQIHTLDSYDLDGFGFTALNGHAYTICIYANMYTEIWLGDASSNMIAESEFEDPIIDSLEGKISSVLKWTASYYGKHMIGIEGRPGYYKIKIIDNGLVE